MSVTPLPGSAGAWLLATRPRTLPVAVAPVLVGAAVAHAAGGARPGPLVAAALGALLLQIGTNLVNDAADASSGADGPDRLGPPRAVQGGLLPSRHVVAGAALAFVLATATGLYLAAVAGPWILVLGVASIAAGIAYTAGPFPLGYHGLGDVTVFAFFGLGAVCGTTFVALGSVPPLAVAAAIPVGALATAVLVVNNVRDAPTDGPAGKRTLVVRLGRRFGIAEYLGLLAAAYAVPVGLAIARESPLPLLPLLSLPLALPLVAAITRSRDGATLNRCLEGTARLLLAHGLLLAIGLAA